MEEHVVKLLVPRSVCLESLVGQDAVVDAYMMGECDVHAELVSDGVLHVNERRYSAVTSCWSLSMLGGGVVDGAVRVVRMVPPLFYVVPRRGRVASASYPCVWVWTGALFGSLVALVMIPVGYVRFLCCSP